jgi:hypothetical protein
MSRNEILYVSYPLLPGVVKCGSCLRGRIRRYKSRCKVCDSMNLAFECLPPEQQLLVTKIDRKAAVIDENYVPACLRNLPIRKRRRRALNKAERGEQAAVLAALRDLYRDIKAKIRDNPEWTSGYNSALAVIETRIKQETERKP